MPPNILQWNCNGFYKHLDNVRYLISEIDPSIMCIQETRFQANHVPKLKNWQIFFKNKTDCRIASGGVAICVQAGMYAEEIALVTDISSVAVKVRYPQTLTICNVYVPPPPNNRIFDQSEFTQLIDQLPRPFLILGDFNAHHGMWGSNVNDRCGSIIERVLLNPQIDLVCINTGKHTHLIIANGTLSSIDLSLCNSNLSSTLEWDTFDDLCGSDHFPIMINFPGITTSNSKRPRFVLKKADWEKYNQLAVTQMDQDLNTIDEQVQYFTNTIITAAKQSIPMSSTKINKKQVPWWNPEISNAIKLRKSAYRLFNRVPSTENLINFKKCRAKEVYLIKKSKRESWQLFVSTIQPQTPYTLAWKKVKAVMGTHRPFAIKSLIHNNTPYTNQEEIVNVLAKTFGTHKLVESLQCKFPSVQG